MIRSAKCEPDERNQKVIPLELECLHELGRCDNL